MRRTSIALMAVLAGFMCWSLAQDELLADAAQASQASSCAYFQGQCVEASLLQAGFSISLRR